LLDLELPGKDAPKCDSAQALNVSRSRLSSTNAIRKHNKQSRNKTLVDFGIEVS
jgi:hypothetical protein